MPSDFTSGKHTSTKGHSGDSFLEIGDAVAAQPTKTHTALGSQLEAVLPLDFRPIVLKSHQWYEFPEACAAMSSTGPLSTVREKG